jgi:hypothetical protein
VSDAPGGEAGDTPAEAEATVTPITVAHGQATPEELAALVAVLAAASGPGEDPAPRHTSVWASRARLLRAPHVPGPGAWRASALPR